MSKIKIIDNLKIVEKNNKKICLKKNNSQKIISIYNYLKSKDFLYYIDTKINNGYEERQFIDEIAINDEDKIHELIYILIMLHTKTTYFKNISLDSIKEFYEKETKEIIKTKEYYESIFDNNLLYTYQKPSIFLLIRKISIILLSLDKSKYYLDMWYKIEKDKKKKRIVLNHNNLKLSNYIRGTKGYLINWNNYLYDYQIYDLVSLFKNNYEIIDMKDIFDIYNLKYPLYEEEKYLFFSILLNIDIIDLNNSEIINTRNVYEMINYLQKINSFLENCMKN